MEKVSPGCERMSDMHYSENSRLERFRHLDSFKEIRFPKSRIATLDIGQISKRKHYITALLEFDVTEARRAIKSQRYRTKQRLSFNAWLIKTLSETISQFQTSHAFLKGKRKALVFDDIDVSITVEREQDGQRVPLPYVIRQTNNKDMFQISQEIDEAKSQTIAGKNVVLGEKKNQILMSLYYALPGAMRRFIWRMILKHPKSAKKNMGSVIVTSVGMMGKVSGWFIHTSVHPLSFGVGSILKKPVVLGDRIEIRDILHMTILIDHDVMDGAPMARFITKLTKNIESAAGLVPAEK